MLRCCIFENHNILWQRAIEKKMAREKKIGGEIDVGGECRKLKDEMQLLKKKEIQDRKTDR